MRLLGQALKTLVFLLICHTWSPWDLCVPSAANVIFEWSSVLTWVSESGQPCASSSMKWKVSVIGIFRIYLCDSRSERQRHLTRSKESCRRKRIETRTHVFPSHCNQHPSHTYTQALKSVPSILQFAMNLLKVKPFGL